MNDLIGRLCAITFFGDVSTWPLQGYPCFATVMAVDSPMVKLNRTSGGLVRSGDVWINVRAILSIEAVD